MNLTETTINTDLQNPYSAFSPQTRQRLFVAMCTQINEYTRSKINMQKDDFLSPKVKQEIVQKYNSELSICRQHIRLISQAIQAHEAQTSEQKAAQQFFI